MIHSALHQNFPQLSGELPVASTFMPPFAFAYGSFGDILATAQLVAKIVITLRRSGRPSRNWIETENELKALGSDLAHLTFHPPSDQFISARIQEEVERCHLVLTRFFIKVCTSQGLVQKLLWPVSEERELAQFRAHVIERRSALGVLVGLINSGAVAAVQDRVDQVDEHIRHAQEGVIGLSMQLAAYQEQIVSVMTQIPRGVSEEMFLVLSPIGEPIPISTLYCTSSKVLDEILNTYMRGQMETGGVYVEKGYYFFVGHDGEVIAQSQLIRAARAGVRLEMGIIPVVTTVWEENPDIVVKNDRSWQLEWCPRCGLDVDDAPWSSSEGATQCQQCGIAAYKMEFPRKHCWLTRTLSSSPDKRRGPKGSPWNTSDSDSEEESDYQPDEAELNSNLNKSGRQSPGFKKFRHVGWVEANKNIYGRQTNVAIEKHIELETHLRLCRVHCGRDDGNRVCYRIKGVGQPYRF
ncbi:hypothetical protein MVEN_01211800 [Mycena venus]|uniref:Ubiquitin-like domain-containing protein n=1 Tax=Mycena venus TaxID=2733690 RepID=A0A8H6Y4W2_9AGAR|nr:hypothetical protein MVEN_01211800 [Mycena venus]